MKTGEMLTRLMTIPMDVEVCMCVVEKEKVYHFPVVCAVFNEEHQSLTLVNSSPETGEAFFYVDGKPLSDR